ncbi:helix-turn-helix domain-containing protein [Gordonia terrae]
MSSPEAVSLPPHVIQTWQQKIGSGEHATGSEAIRLNRQAGHSCGRHVELATRSPGGFDAMIYVRRFSILSTFCSLHTPLDVVRSPQLITQQPSVDLVVSVHSLRGCRAVRQGPGEVIFGPGELTLVNNAVPYTVRNDEITDPAGLVIPLELLGLQGGAVEQGARPGKSLLSQATAAFVLRFATQAAIGVAKPDHDTEMAAIALIRTTLGMLDTDSTDLTANTLVVREVVAKLIERHHRDPSFTPDAIARRLHISRRQLYRHFEDSRQSLASRITERRLDSACTLLRARPRMSLADVAHTAGFSSLAKMRNQFAKHLQISPSQYREASAGRPLNPEDKSTPSELPRE